MFYEDFLGGEVKIEGMIKVMEDFEVVWGDMRESVVGEWVGGRIEGGLVGGIFSSHITLDLFKNIGIWLVFFKRCSGILV
ncbi:hypothetical protein [Vibrio sp. AH4]|uniref:hypothetical protein n=1 Tax=Vibrio sp. AH4 TaxID=2919577 RepID=UPI002738458C|nr:hypothetical protein [Vibrio sp. AH4]MDP4492916.1 hypothetical protein [Vibrio sp. AH4]